MKLDKEKLLKNDPVALKDLERVCRECARIGASSVGALDFVDDIVQEVMIKLLTEWIRDYNPEREVEPTLISAAKFVGQTMRRRHGREVLMGDGGDETFPESWINSIADPNHEDIGDRVDREANEQRAEGLTLLAMATKEFSLALEAAPDEENGGEAVVAPSHEPESPPSASVAKQAKAGSAASKKPSARGKAVAAAAPTNAWDAINPHAAPEPKMPKRSLSKGAVRLREIRLAVRYTHEQMAAHLSLDSVGQLHAIEYGVSLPPDSLVEKAEALLTMIEQNAPALMQDDFTLVVQGWLKRLGLASDDYGGFARVLSEALAPRKVNRSTVFRWLRGTYKPSPELLWSIEAVVQAGEAQRAEILKNLPKTA
jgi:DNA-directed RNA polymerase specialized sigma24 family protein